MKRVLSFLTLLLFAIGLGRTAWADGLIVIEEPPERIRRMPRPHFPLEVRNHNVTVKISDKVAKTHVDQIFYNPSNVQLEGTYLFPIPEDASLSKFSMYMEVDGKEVEVEGEVLAAPKAKEIYEGIVRSMRDPALLEYMGRGLFKARVFPIPARGEKRVKISYTQVLKPVGNQIGYRYPLNTEKFSAKPLQSCTIQVDLEAPTPLGTIFSPSHPIDVHRHGPNKARVGFEAQNVKPDEDFLLSFDRSDQDLGFSLHSYKDPTTGTSYFLAILSPKVQREDPLPKDVVFVFDTSGSMAGVKMDQARGALEYCVNSLNPGDRFNIVDFSTEARSLSESLLSFDKTNRDRALAYIERMKARGGTDIHGALTRALKMWSEEGKENERPRMVCFLTDGLPTVGSVTDPKAIEKEIAGLNNDARLFAFGVGTDVNTHFLDRIATTNRGTSEYILPQENIEVRVSSFFDKVSQPVLTNLSLAFDGIEVLDRYPRDVPDLFYGSQIEVVGSYRGGGHRAIRLEGTMLGKKTSHVFEASFDGAESNEFVPRIWATRKVGYLLEQIRLHGENNEVKQEVIRLAKRYGIVTPYTSYLITEDSAPQGDVIGGALRRRGGRVPGAPEETAEAEEAAAGFGSDEGEDSVSVSRELSELKKGTAANAPRSKAEEDRKQAREEVIRTIGDRTFYRDADGTWVDSRFDPKKDETKTVKAFSDRYFELVSENPELGRYLTLGNVVVEFDGTFYRIES